MTPLRSIVDGHRGPCLPTWVNKNQVLHRLDDGVTGFFRLVEERKGWRRIFGRWKKVGKEFHGIIKPDNVVKSTQRWIKRDEEIFYRSEQPSLNEINRKTLALK